MVATFLKGLNTERRSVSLWKEVELLAELETGQERTEEGEKGAVQ